MMFTIARSTRTSAYPSNLPRTEFSFRAPLGDAAIDEVVDDFVVPISKQKAIVLAELEENVVRNGDRTRLVCCNQIG